VNISSPNTPGLRALQFGESLNQLLQGLKDKQLLLQNQYQRYVPMAVKVAPDLSLAEVEELSTTFSRFEIDAVIATNTTMEREAVTGMEHSEEAGGLSGRPVFDKSTTVVSQFRQALPEHLPIIAVGGIMSADDAMEKLDAGASLVQIYSGLIYRGPQLISDIVNATAMRK
jgi:dihydroorotate dehydrogenase